MRPTCWLVGAVLILASTPVLPAGAQTPVPRVVVEVAFDGTTLEGSPGLVTEMAPGTPVSLTARVSDADGTPRDLDDTATLLEIRHRDRAMSPVRFGDMTHVAVGVYQAEFAPPSPGHWDVIVLPDVGDRSVIPDGSADSFTLLVIDAGPAAGAEGSSTRLIATIALLAALVLVLVFLYRRRHQRQSAPPIPFHDTWWNSP